MEKSEYSFGAYRYFIVPNDQISLFDAIEEKRKKAVQNFFSALVEEKKRSWEIKGRKHLLVFNRQVSSSVFICKFSMETKKTIFIESESDIENIDEIDYPFITFVGVVLGISATIVTFIFSSTEKIQKVISNLSHEKNRTDKINRIFKTAYAELIEDSSFIFIIFILLIICVLFSAIDIPYISFPAFMPKSQFLDSIKIGLFLNCIFSISDLFFSLSNILRLVLYENSTKQ